MSGIRFFVKSSFIFSTALKGKSIKVNVNNIIVKCPKHGEVLFTATSDFGDVVTLYCPRCEAEAREQYKHPDSPYPVQGTSPSVIEACGRGD